MYDVRPNARLSCSGDVLHVPSAARFDTALTASVALHVTLIDTEYRAALIISLYAALSGNILTNRQPQVPVGHDTSASIMFLFIRYMRAAKKVRSALVPLAAAAAAGDGSGDGGVFLFGCVCVVDGPSMCVIASICCNVRACKRWPICRYLSLVFIYGCHYLKCNETRLSALLITICACCPRCIIRRR